MKKKITLLVVLAAVMALSSCVLNINDTEGSLRIENDSWDPITKIWIGDDTARNYDGDEYIIDRMRVFWNGGKITHNEHKTFDLEEGKYVVSVETVFDKRHGYYCFDVDVRAGKTTTLYFDGDELLED